MIDDMHCNIFDLNPIYDGSIWGKHKRLTILRLVSIVYVPRRSCDGPSYHSSKYMDATTLRYDLNVESYSLK